MTIVVNIANTTSFLSSNGSTSISNTTGALVVTGGLGVSGNVYSANILIERHLHCINIVSPV